MSRFHILWKKYFTEVDRIFAQNHENCNFFEGHYTVELRSKLSIDMLRQSGNIELVINLRFQWFRTCIDLILYRFLLFIDSHNLIPLAKLQPTMIVESKILYDHLDTQHLDVSICIFVGETDAVYRESTKILLRQALYRNEGEKWPLNQPSRAEKFCTHHRIFVLRGMANCLTNRFIFRSMAPLYPPDWT